MQSDNVLGLRKINKRFDSVVALLCLSIALNLASVGMLVYQEWRFYKSQRDFIERMEKSFGPRTAR